MPWYFYIITSNWFFVRTMRGSQRRGLWWDSPVDIYKLTEYHTRFVGLIFCVVREGMVSPKLSWTNMGSFLVCGKKTGV